jgi:hypothetical protein
VDRLPAYRGPQLKPPHISDASYFYTLGIPVVSSGAGEMGFEYPAYVGPPLAQVERASDIPLGYLTQRLAHFDFAHMISRQAGAPQTAGEPLSYEAIAALQHWQKLIKVVRRLLEKKQIWGFQTCNQVREEARRNNPINHAVVGGQGQ